MKEQVAVVKRSWLNKLIKLPTVGVFGLENISDVIAKLDEKLFFKSRDNVEQDPTYKQVIPYIIIFQGKKIFATERLEKSGDSRLHGFYSVGIGGHINRCDRDADDSTSTIHSAARRELYEEVDIKGEYDFFPVALVNDDIANIGKVHIGVVYFLFLGSKGKITVKETDKLKGIFVNESDVEKLELEGWAEEIMAWIKLEKRKALKNYFSRALELD